MGSQLSTLSHALSLHLATIFTLIHLPESISKPLIHHPIVTLIFTLLITRRIITRTASYLHFLRFSRAHGCASPSSLIPFDIFGLTVIPFMIFFNGDILDEKVLKQYKEAGPGHNWTYTRKHFLIGTMTDTASPKNLQSILATNFQDWELGNFRRRMFMNLFGHGIFTADGPQWQWARKIMKPQFNRAQVEDMEAAEEHVLHLWEAVERGGGEVREGEEAEGRYVDMCELLLRFTLDSATQFLFGESVGSQKAGMAAVGYEPPTGKVQEKSSVSFQAGGAKSEEMGFSKAFSYGCDVIQRKVRWGPLMWVLENKAYRDACDTVHKFTDHFVEKAYARQRLMKSGAAPDEGRFILADALAADITDPIELRYQLLNILLAGRDTTASLLSWAFLLLSRHPEKLDKLRSECLAAFGTDPKSITFTGMKNVKYLQYVMSETLRLYPAVPLNARQANKDTVLPVGGGKNGDQPIAIMKDQIVFYSVYALHRLEELWGEDAHEFRPERWEGRKHGFEFLPFNGGPRICLGRKFFPNSGVKARNAGG